MEVAIEVRDDHVHAVVKGEFDALKASQGMDAIMAACRDAKVSRVLIDGRAITTKVSVMHRYDIATGIADVAPMTLRMAIVVSRENMFTKTLENTALNLGVAVRTTDSMAEALTFLGLQKWGSPPAPR